MTKEEWFELTRKASEAVANANAAMLALAIPCTAGWCHSKSVSHWHDENNTAWFADGSSKEYPRQVHERGCELESNGYWRKFDGCDLGHEPQQMPPLSGEEIQRQLIAMVEGGQDEYEGTCCCPECDNWVHVWDDHREGCRLLRALGK